jgi:hypothetical protein
MQVQIGDRTFDVGGKYFTAELRDSRECLDDVAALQARMAEDGYLFIRGLHDRDQVLAARKEILEKLAANGKLDPSAPLDDALPNPTSSEPPSGSVRGKEHLKDGPELKALIEGPPVMGFFDRYFGKPALTFDFKWLRVVGPGISSTMHYDIVYMGRGTKNLYTGWTPLGDVPLDLGPVVICLGSHRFEKIKATYGQMDVDRDLIQGWFSNDPAEMVDTFGGRWAGTDFQAGDVLIMSMFLMHASITNATNRLRLSVDTRYQPADEPVDDRWVGSVPKTHTEYWKPDAQLEPLEQSREKWGV